MKQETQKSWLKITAFVIFSFAPVFFLGSMEETSEPARITLDILSWPLDDIQTFDEPTTRFLSALAGGFLLGWGMCIWFLQKWVYDKAPEEVRKTIVYSTLFWFILDSSGSILSGNFSNIFFNIGILLIAIGPLWIKAEDNK